MTYYITSHLRLTNNTHVLYEVMRWYHVNTQGAQQEITAWNEQLGNGCFSISSVPGFISKFYMPVSYCRGVGGTLLKEIASLNQKGFPWLLCKHHISAYIWILILLFLIINRYSLGFPFGGIFMQLNWVDTNNESVMSAPVTSSDFCFLFSFLRFCFYGKDVAYSLLAMLYHTSFCTKMTK